MSSPLDQEKVIDRDVRGGSRCELDNSLEILRRVPVFSGIPLDQLKLFAYLSSRSHFRAGEFVFRQQERGNLGYVVIQGKARVIREYEDHSIFLNDYQEGDFFGGMALMSDIARLFSVKAVTDLQCLTIDRETFQRVFVQFPEVGIKMLDFMIKRIIQMEERLLQAKADECMYG
jgi:CRP-like cAMP-binding protein